MMYYYVDMIIYATVNPEILMSFLVFFFFTNEYRMMVCNSLFEEVFQRSNVPILPIRNAVQ